MTIKLSNMKLYMSSVMGSIKLLVISTMLATMIISVQSCDEQETSPAYTKTINWMRRGFDRLKCLDNSSPFYYYMFIKSIKG